MGLHQRHSSSGNLKRTMSLEVERKRHHVVSQKDLPKPIQIGSPNVSARSKSKSRSTGKTVRKPAAEAPRSLLDDDLDFDKHFDKGRCSTDDDDYTWLSGGASPSTFFREYRLSGAYNVDSRLVSWLSKLADSYLSFTGKAEEENSEEQQTDDASTKCSEDSSQKGCKEDLDSILSWNPGGIRACSRRSWEEATHCSCSLSPLSACHDSSRASESGRTNSVFSSQLSDIRRTNSMVSLLDEVCHLNNFTDRSCQSIWFSEAKLSDIRNELDEPASQGEQNSEALEESNCNGEEPIFWPFNHNWNSEESWTYFSMSPLKDRPRLRSAEGNLTPSIGSKHRGRSPSRLEDSVKASAKVVPLESDSHIIKQRNVNDSMLKSVTSNSNFMEDGHSPSIDLPIETVVGLEEFNGHEGINSEFNEEIFVLDELF